MKICLALIEMIAPKSDSNSILHELQLCCYDTVGTAGSGAVVSQYRTNVLKALHFWPSIRTMIDLRCV